jgi:hypothetical protein
VQYRSGVSLVVGAPQVLGKLRAAGFDVMMAAHIYSLLDAYIYGFALTKMNLPFETTAEVAESMLQPFPSLSASSVRPTTDAPVGCRECDGLDAHDAAEANEAEDANKQADKEAARPRNTPRHTMPACASGPSWSSKRKCGA